MNDVLALVAAGEKIPTRFIETLFSTMMMFNYIPALEMPGTQLDEVLSRGLDWMACRDLSNTHGSDCVNLSGTQII